MHTLDPDSPLDSARCGLCRQTHELGGIDCDGEPVGWIEGDPGRPDGWGTMFVDRRERDRALAGGRACDAWSAYNRHGGLLGPEPDYLAIIRAHGCLPEHESEALDALECHVDLLATPLGIHLRDQRARLN